MQSTGTGSNSSGGGPAANAPKPVASNLPTNSIIRGYTKHGAEQVMGRDGGIGVSNAAILNAVNNPIAPPTVRADGAIKFIGQNATVVINPSGYVITAWSTNYRGRR